MKRREGTELEFGFHPWKNPYSHRLHRESFRGSALDCAVQTYREMLVVEQQGEQREQKAVVDLSCEKLMLVGTKLGFFPHVNLFQRFDSQRCDSKPAIKRIYALTFSQENAQCCTMRRPMSRCIKFAPSPREVMISTAQTIRSNPLRWIQYSKAWKCVKQRSCENKVLQWSDTISIRFFEAFSYPARPCIVLRLDEMEWLEDVLDTELTFFKCELDELADFDSSTMLSIR